MVYERLYPCSVVLTNKTENRNDNYEQGCERKLILKKLSLSG